MGLQVHDAVTPMLARAHHAVENPREILRAGILQMVSITERSFNDPSQRAAPWKELKPSTIAEKKRAGKSLAILKRDGLLWRSFRVESVNNHEAVMASDRPYAGTQQFGTKNGRIPARPFIPFVGPPGSAVMAPFAQKKITEVMQEKFDHLVS